MASPNGVIPTRRTRRRPAAPSWADRHVNMRLLGGAAAHLAARQQIARGRFVVYLRLTPIQGWGFYYVTALARLSLYKTPLVISTLSIKLDRFLRDLPV